MIALIEPLLLAIGKIDLATGFLINIVLPPPLQRERKLVFFCVVAILKEKVWKSQVRGIVTGAFISDQEWVRFLATFKNRC